MKLSIITINYNNFGGLKKTTGSVFSQTFKDFEYIVIDGASTDGSAEYIKSFADKLTYWVSEPDTGIYNAMNKGILASNGEYLLMLNSGDYLVNDNVVETIMPNLIDYDIIQGNILIEQNGKIVRKNGYGKSDISFIEVMDGNFLHQASFIKKTLHNEYGLYDESYKKCSDSYFFWKVLGFGNASFKYLDVDISYFDMNGISNNPQWAIIGEEEVERWYRENFPVRLQKLYREAPKKIQLYDKLHSNKILWYIIMLLLRFTRK